jgi:hypothetical protein
MATYPAAGITLTAAVLGGQSAYKPTDQSLASSTTLQDDNALSLTLTANGIYRFLCWLYITGTTAKVSFAFSGSAQWSTVNGGGVVTSSGSVSGSYAAGGWLLAGTITAASGGDTLQLEWAQNSSSATATVVKAGSILTMQRLS